MPQKRKRRRRQRKSPTQRRQHKQLGEGVGAVVAGIPKAAWKITKGLETLAEKKCSKESFETHGGNQKWETKTVCRGILQLQYHVSCCRV